MLLHGWHNCEVGEGAIPPCFPSYIFFLPAGNSELKQLGDLSHFSVVSGHPEMFAKHLETWGSLGLHICTDQIRSALKAYTVRLTCPCPVRRVQWTLRLTTGVRREKSLVFLSRKVQKKENVFAVALEGPLCLQSLCQSCVAGQPMGAGNNAPVLWRVRFWKICFLTQSFLQHPFKSRFLLLSRHAICRCVGFFEIS